MAAHTGIGMSIRRRVLICSSLNGHELNGGALFFINLTSNANARPFLGGFKHIVLYSMLYTLFPPSVIARPYANGIWGAP